MSFDNCDYCNRCGEKANNIEPLNTVGGNLAECATICAKCGFEDYWAYGRFESGKDGYNSSKKYKMAS